MTLEELLKGRLEIFLLCFVADNYIILAERPGIASWKKKKIFEKNL